MKKIFFLSLISLFSMNSFAKGYDCEALCVVLDSKDSTLYYLDQINIVAGTTKRETHKLLQKKCQTLARQYGFGYGSLIVDSLEYRSSRTDESDSSGSYSSSNSGWVTAVGVKAQDRRGNVYAGYRLDFSVNRSSSSTYQQRDHRNRQLDIRLTPSNADAACIIDEYVADGNIPYTGGIIIH